MKTFSSRVYPDRWMTFCKALQILQGWEDPHFREDKKYHAAWCSVVCISFPLR